MNCATHNEVAAVAYCRTCGKPLCATCTRDVRGVIYCENCLAARLEGVQPQQTVYQQAMDQRLGMKVPPASGEGPNPTVAGILAGFFPVGVGAVYTGQYAKGLAHLGIVVLLIVGLSAGLRWYLVLPLAILTGFFYFYQIMDAVRSAKALQTGQPAPDPFGLAETFTAGQKVDTSKVPTAAVVLIGLGVLFLLHTISNRQLGFEWILPSFLILLGGWLFARRLGLAGVAGTTSDVRDCRRRSLVGPTVLVTLGGLRLFHNVHELDPLTWVGVLLVVIGLAKVLQRDAFQSDRLAVPPFQAGTGSPGAASEGQPPSEVKNG